MTPEPRRLGSESASESESPQEPGSPAEEDASPQGAQADAQSAAARAPARAKGAKRARSFWRDLVIIVFAALVLTILLKTFVTQVFAIPTGSMENTLQPGDRVLVNKLVYRFRDIARGDVVVFSGQGSWGPDAPPPPGNPLVRFWDGVTNLIGISAPGTDYIKRVIGVPGDHVACCDAGRVTVNGVPLSEQSYVHPGETPSQVPFSVTVPPGRLWVLGDNRANSDDSRYRRDDPGSGTIPESAVVGRAFVIIWPPSRIGDLPIPATFGQAGLRAAAAGAVTAPAVGGYALAVGLLRRRRRRSGEIRSQ